MIFHMFPERLTEEGTAQGRSLWGPEGHGGGGRARRLGDGRRQGPDSSAR